MGSRLRLRRAASVALAGGRPADIGGHHTSAHHEADGTVPAASSARLHGVCSPRARMSAQPTVGVRAVRVAAAIRRRCVRLWIAAKGAECLAPSSQWATPRFEGAGESRRNVARSVARARRCVSASGRTTAARRGCRRCHHPFSRQDNWRESTLLRHMKSFVHTACARRNGRSHEVPPTSQERSFQELCLRSRSHSLWPPVACSPGHSTPRWWEAFEFRWMDMDLAGKSPCRQPRTWSLARKRHSKRRGRCMPPQRGCEEF